MLVKPIFSSLVTEVTVVSIVCVVFLILMIVAGIRQAMKED